jgi:teichuronic acid biosynthesis glycosyltransferase TuaC
MKVLFVSSGNSGGSVFLIKNQALSLIEQGIDVIHFHIKGKGAIGYLKNIPKLRAELKSGNYDIVHAHYAFSGFMSTLGGCKNLIVSLMGSDVYTSIIIRLFSRVFYTFFWGATIVKTKKMSLLLKMPDAFIIPNGVDLNRYKIISKISARAHIGYSGNKKLVIFVSDPKRKEKNFGLAKLSVEHLGRTDIELLQVFNVPNKEIPFYMNSADVLLLTSKYEGSVNVVKEAMACNLPIVSTDVGDIKENLLSVRGCYVCKSEPNSLAEGLKKALLMEDRTNGRERIISLKLDSGSIAKKIIAVYEQIAKPVKKGTII